MSNYPLTQPDRIIKPEPQRPQKEDKTLYQATFDMIPLTCLQRTVPVLFRRSFPDIMVVTDWSKIRCNLQLPRKTVTVGQLQRECQASGLDLSLAKDDTQRKLDDLLSKIQILLRFMTEPYFHAQYGSPFTYRGPGQCQASPPGSGCDAGRDSADGQSVEGGSDYSI